MKGLDTNVLVRLLTGDDPAQQQRARAFIASNCSAASPGFVNRIVIVELVWVLESTYGYTRQQIAAAIDGLLRTQELTVEDTSEVALSLSAYREGADFADALLSITNEAAGCEETATFDRRAAKRLAGFRVL
ncbi:PIN domain-containing protein [bacterium]|nr:MAG: PIN domain-containing protein [bacterium]